MSVTRIASRYAKSLLDLSKEKDKVEEVKNDVSSLQHALENRDLFLLMKSPIVKTQKKVQIVDTIFKGKLSDITLLFVEKVIKKSRENVLVNILDSYMDQYRDYKNITMATLVTAEELDAKTLEIITAKLLESNITDENVDLTTEVDPSLIGGYIIKVGDKIYDASVAHKLNNMRKELVS